ncbi:MAG: ABC transporter substrate-binding protein, partial [Bacillota bacterium]
MDKESTEARSQGEVGTEPIGTGAYRLDDWVKGSYLEMSANPDYWEGAPAIDHAEYRPISETSTRLASISGGSIDILQGVPVNFVEQVQENENLELITRPGRRSIFLPMTSDEDSPLSDVRVRQAIYMAIDIDEIIEQVMYGQASPAAQIPDPPTLGYSDEIERLPFDPDRARELLAEAGYPDGFEITLDGPNNRYVQDEQIMQAVAGYLERIGITTEVDAKPMTIFFEEVANQELDFYLIGWFDGSYDFGRSFTQLLHSIDSERGLGGLNGARYSDEVLDTLYDAATKIITPEIRGANLRVLNRLAMSQEKLAVIPLHYQVDSYAIYQGRGINFTPRSDTWIVFKEMSYNN